MGKIEKKNQEQEKGMFVPALENIISDLPKRSQDIVWNRFGIGGSDSATLEEIGKKFGITRERVRQVIREVCKKVRARKSSEALASIRKKITFTLESNSGIMDKDKLLKELGNGNSKEMGAASFFLECLDEARSFEIKGFTEKSFSIPGFSQDRWEVLKNAALNVLKKKGTPEMEDDLYGDFVKNQGESEITKKSFVDWLSVSLEIKKNTFGKWGLSQWKEIKPKGTRDKAYLVLKEYGKPMHFKQIAEQIDKSGLNRKKTHAQTVHNELIKDKKFVLVGRGIYALSEWGYRKGTVKDVIEEILSKNIGGLKKDEIIDQVLKIRQVKKSTVVINLNNYFKKNKEGRYLPKK